jgi:hypothetical protein
VVAVAACDLLARAGFDGAEVGAGVRVGAGVAVARASVAGASVTGTSTVP